MLVIPVGMIPLGMILITLYCYIKVYTELKKGPTSSPYIRQITRLFIFPVIMLFIGIWPFLANLSQFFYGEQYWITEIFQTLYYLSISSIGLMDSLAYGWNIRKKFDESSLLVLDKTITIIADGSQSKSMEQLRSNTYT